MGWWLKQCRIKLSVLLPVSFCLFIWYRVGDSLLWGMKTFVSGGSGGLEESGSNFLSVLVRIAESSLKGQGAALPMYTEYCLLLMSSSKIGCPHNCNREKYS